MTFSAPRALGSAGQSTTPAEPHASGAPAQLWGGATRFCAALVVVAFLVSLLPVPAVANQVLYLLVMIGSGALAILGARRGLLGPTALFIGVGITVSAGGDVVWQLLAWSSGEGPVVSVADLLWLGAYMCVGAALLRWLSDGNGLDRAGIVDVAVVFLVTLLVQWELAFDQIVTDATLPVGERLVSALYPTGDAALLALVVRAAISRRIRGRLAVLMGAGIGCWLVADFAYYLVSADESFERILGIPWMLGSMLMAAATLVAGPGEVRPVSTGDAGTVQQGSEGTRRGGIAIALVPLLVPGVVAVACEARGDKPHAALLLSTTAALVALAYARGARILRDEATARAAVRSQERFSHAVAMNSSDAFAVLGRDGLVVNDTPKLAALLGFPGAPTVGRDVFRLVSSDDHDDATAVFERCLAAPGRQFVGEFRARHGDGHHMWLRARMVNLLEDPDVRGIVVNLHDISERRRVEDELAHQALHDSLTGLPNRALFADRVGHALLRCGRTGLAPAVLLLDLDGFKTVNDTMGHAAGDRLLRAAAQRLMRAAGGGDTVARLGGDEFAILVAESAEPLGEAEAVAARVLETFGDAILVEGSEVRVTASIGIAAGTADSDPDSLLRDADIAMYGAKAAGRARWVVYEAEMRSALVERLRLERDLAGALGRKQFTLEYQPVIELASGDVVGFEALVRWRHPSLGLVGPDRFIPIAEETGLIQEIGRWVLSEACDRLALWRRRHVGRRITMAVNVSGRQLASLDLVADVRAALDASGVDAGDLVLEITETALIQDTDVAAERLGELRALGVRLAIDDFGTGYSSLSYLRQFPVDILKIDRSFISSIVDRDEVPAIVRGLLDLGRTLGLETVAEGVELEVQRDQLRAEHCDLAQGYLFSRPLGVEEAEASLAAAPTGAATARVAS